MRQRRPLVLYSRVSELLTLSGGGSLRGGGGCMRRTEVGLLDTAVATERQPGLRRRRLRRRCLDHVVRDDQQDTQQKKHEHTAIHLQQ